MQLTNQIISKNFSDKNFIAFGINRLDEEQGQYYNSFVIINNNFEIIQQYDKQKLVPFGEFLPLENFLNNFGFKK